MLVWGPRATPRISPTRLVSAERCVSHFSNYELQPEPYSKASDWPISKGPAGKWSSRSQRRHSQPHVYHVILGERLVIQQIIEAKDQHKSKLHAFGAQLSKWLRLGGRRSFKRSTHDPFYSSKKKRSKCQPSKDVVGISATDSDKHVLVHMCTKNVESATHTLSNLQFKAAELGTARLFLGRPIEIVVNRPRPGDTDPKMLLLFV